MWSYPPTLFVMPTSPSPVHSRRVRTRLGADDPQTTLEHEAIGSNMAPSAGKSQKFMSAKLSSLTDGISGFAPFELADDKLYELLTPTGVGCCCLCIYGFTPGLCSSAKESYCGAYNVAI